MNRLQTILAFLLGAASVPQFSNADILKLEERLGGRFYIGVVNKDSGEDVAAGAGLFYQLHNFVGAYGAIEMGGDDGGVKPHVGVHLLTPRVGNLLRGYVSLGVGNVTDYGVQINTNWINELIPANLPDPTLTFGKSNAGDGGFRVGISLGSLVLGDKKDKE